MSTNIPRLPNDENEEIMVYLNEFVTHETINRGLLRLLANDKFLYNLLSTKVDEMMQIARGLGTTQDFTINEVTYFDDTTHKSRIYLTENDFGKFYVMKGREGTANISDLNPCIILPSIDKISDDYIGSCFTITCKSADDTIQGKNCRIYSNLDDSEKIPFYNNMIDNVEPYALIYNKDENTQPNCIGSLCRITLIKDGSQYYWLFDGNGDFWKPLNLSDSNTYWTNDNL